jgi:hypothetical protein
MLENCASLSVVEAAAEAEVDDSLCPSDPVEPEAVPLPCPRPREPLESIALGSCEPRVMSPHRVLVVL